MQLQEKTKHDSAEYRGLQGRADENWSHVSLNQPRIEAERPNNQLRSRGGALPGALSSSGLSSIGGSPAGVVPSSPCKGLHDFSSAGVHPER